MFLKKNGINACSKMIVLPLLIFAGGFFIYDYFQIKDPKYYFDLGKKASLTRDIPIEIKNFRKAVHYCNKDLSKYSSLAVSSYLWLAIAYMHKSELGKAEETLLEGLDVSLKYFGFYSGQTWSIYRDLGLYAEENKRIDKAAHYYSKCLEISEKLNPEDRKNLAYACRYISALYKKAKDELKSVEYNNKANEYMKGQSKESKAKPLKGHPTKSGHP